jgi:hypothetical protein
MQGKPENIAKITPKTEKRDGQACLNGVFLSQHQRGCRLKQVCIPFFDAQTFAELQGKTEKVFLLSCIEGL